MKKRINLFFSEKQYLNLELLLVKYGDSAPEFIRSLIRKAFEKEFGSYKSPSSMKIKPIKESDIEPELDLTAEQWCEKGGGVVKMKDGMMQAVFPLGGENFPWSFTWACPIDNLKRIKRYVLTGKTDG